MKKLLLILLVSLPLLAGDLFLKEGYVKAHTEMMWEDIEPRNDKLQVELNIQGDDLSTLSGKFWLDMNLFVSDKTDRDEHMYKDMKVDKFLTSTFTISKVTPTKSDNGFVIEGTLNFFGTDKFIKADALIIKKDGLITLDAKSSIDITDFGMEQVCMFIMCVDKKVDFIVKAILK